LRDGVEYRRCSLWWWAWSRDRRGTAPWYDWRGWGMRDDEANKRVRVILFGRQLNHKNYYYRIRLAQLLEREILYKLLVLITRIDCLLPRKKRPYYRSGRPDRWGPPSYYSARCWRYPQVPPPKRSSRTKWGGGCLSASEPQELSWLGLSGNMWTPLLLMSGGIFSFHAIFLFEIYLSTCKKVIYISSRSIFLFLWYISQSATRWIFVFLFSPYYFLFEMQVAGWKLLSNRHAPPVSPMKISSFCGASRPCFL